MLEPNATLYVKNIDWKIKKGLLRRALYSLFSRHGKVLEIVALRKDGLRGQAFVIMDSIPSASAALQAEQGFTFFEKDLVIEYAKEKSDRVARRDGTYVPKAKRQKVAQHPNEPPQSGEGDAVGTHPPHGGPPLLAATGDAASAQETVDSTPPSKFLLAQNLPPEVNQAMLEMLFRQYSGFKEVRMPRPGLAFVEFEEEAHATVAKKALAGFLITATDHLQLVYGKD